MSSRPQPGSAAKKGFTGQGFCLQWGREDIVAG